MTHLAPPFARRALSAALLLLAGAAHAQYVWIDAKGTRQYSDRPPPPSTPRAKILKAPGQAALAPVAQQAAEAAEPAAPAEAAQAPKKKGPPTLAERELDFRKRQQERAQQDQKAAQEAQRKQAQEENCASARQYKAQLDSGIRVATTNGDGERAFMSDEERARQQARVNRVLADCR